MDDIVSPPAMQRESSHSVIDLPDAAPGPGEAARRRSDSSPPLSAARGDALTGSDPPHAGAPETKGPPERGGGPLKLFLLGGVAMIIVAGGAAGYTYRRPLLEAVHRFEIAHGMSAVDHTAKVRLPAPVNPAQRLAANALHAPAAQAVRSGRQTSPMVSAPASPSVIHVTVPALNPAVAGIDGLKAGESTVTASSRPVPAGAASLAGSAVAPAGPAKPMVASGQGTTSVPAAAGASGRGVVAKPPGAASSLARNKAGQGTARPPVARTITPASEAPGAAATLATVSHPVDAAKKLVAAPMTPRAQIDVISLVSELGLTVGELRTENAHLVAELAGMRHDMTTQLADFDRRLTFDQAHDRLALAGAAHPDVHPAPDHQSRVFPAPRATPAEHVKPSSYRIEAASPSVAILSHDGQSLEVSVGSAVPGVGQVVAIRQYGADWQVVTTHGMIR